MDEKSRNVPQFYELFNPTLRALKKLGGSASIDELLDEIIADLSIPDAIADVPHGEGGSQTEVGYRSAWARTYLKKAGLVDNSERGVWSLTAKGRETKRVDSTRLVREVRKQHRKKPDRGKGKELPDGDGEDTWEDAVLSILGSMDPTAFERLCQRLLRESGFTEVEVTKKTGDGGIDGHGLIRIGGLISFPVLFQSKRWAGNIGPDTVRDFRGAMMGRADKGLLITTGGFTREARREATRDGAPPIDLIDGELLVQKLKELGLGVRVTTRTVEEVSVDEEWFEQV